MRDYWEFPGGKVASGETPESALSRELEEELGIEVERADFLLSIRHDYPHLKVAVDFYRVVDWTGSPQGAEGQAIRWVSRMDLGDQRLLPADKPVIDKLTSP